MDYMYHTTFENIPELLAALESEDGFTRQDARRLLVSIGDPAVPGLIKTLQSRNIEARWEAAKALGQIRSPGSAPGLVLTLEDPDLGVRWAAAEALINLGRAGLEPLLEALRENSASVRLRQGAQHVLHQLYKTGHLSKEEAAVYHALGEIAPDIKVPWAAETALEQIWYS